MTEQELQEQDRRNEEFLDDLLAEYLPHWADKKLDGELELYAQLQTLDGRKMGNAIIIDILEDDRLPFYLKDIGPIYVILTDFGHTIRLTQKEVAHYYHPTVYRMKESRVKFRIDFMKDYVLCDNSICDQPEAHALAT